MRNLILLILGVLLAGCNSGQTSQGIGIVPMKGATLTGKVVESTPSGVLVKTESQRSFLLPDSWQYRQDNQRLESIALAPGDVVTAMAPASESRLVSAADRTLVLEGDDGFYSFPYEALPPGAQRAPVRVQLGTGYREMPLQQAMRLEQGTILSHPYYSSYDFPQAEPHLVDRGLVVGTYGQTPLFLSPTGQGGQLMRLPDYYPSEPLVSHRPVRFTYSDDDVRVTSWDALGDGQFHLSHLLLAGTLLDILPGQAILDIGSTPVAVPWSYVTHQGVPVGPRRFPIGTPLGVEYYPGAYDLVSYDGDIMTFLYNQQCLQVPVAKLPPHALGHRVKVKKPRGKWVSVPMRTARQLVATGDYVVCPSERAVPLVTSWQNRKPLPVRGLKNRPDLKVVNYGAAGARVVRHENRRDRVAGNDGWPVQAGRRDKARLAQSFGERPKSKGSGKAAHNPGKSRWENGAFGQGPGRSERVAAALPKVRHEAPRRQGGGDRVSPKGKADRMSNQGGGRLTGDNRVRRANNSAGHRLSHAGGKAPRIQQRSHNRGGDGQRALRANKGGGGHRVSNNGSGPRAQGRSRGGGGGGQRVGGGGSGVPSAGRRGGGGGGRGRH